MANQRQSLKWNRSCSFFGKGALTDEDILSYCMRIVWEGVRTCVRVCECCAGSMCFNWQGSGPWGWPTCSSLAALGAKKADKKGTQVGDRMRPSGHSYVIKKRKKTDRYVWWGFGVGNPSTVQFCSKWYSESLPLWICMARFASLSWLIRKGMTCYLGSVISAWHIAPQSCTEELLWKIKVATYTASDSIYSNYTNMRLE